MADNTREILRAIEENLIRIPGDDKIETPIVKDKIPAVMCDFAASVQKLRELQPMISQGDLTAKQQADAFVATKCVVITIEKFSEGTSEDKISDNVLSPGSLNGFLTELGISGIVDYTLNDLFPNGDTEKLEQNPYLDKDTPERLEITYNDYGASDNIVDIEGPADRNYTTIHTSEERNLIFSSDDNDEFPDLEKGSDGRGHEHVDIRTCPPEQNTFLSIIDPADKKDLWEHYKNGEDVQIVDRPKDLEWERDQYKEAIDKVIEEAPDGEKGDAYAEAARLYELGGFDKDTVEEAHANAAIEYDREGEINSAYKESVLAENKIPAESKAEFLDNAIRFESYNAIGNTDLSNEDKGEMNNAVNIGIEGKDPAAVRKEFETRGIAVPESLEQLLQNKEIELGIKEPESRIETPESDSRQDTVGNENVQDIAVAVESTAPETEKTENANDTAADHSDNLSKADTSTTDAKQEKPVIPGYTFTSKDAVTPKDLEKAANTFLDLFKDESIEKEIRDKLGDEKADHYKELLVELAGAVASVSAGNNTEDLRDKIDGIAKEITDICGSIQPDPVDKGTEHKESDQDAKDRTLLDKLIDLGKKAHIDPHNNRAVRYSSNNPFQIGAAIDYCSFIKGMDDDDYKRITGQEKPQMLNTALAFNVVNYVRAWSLSNISAAYAEAIYQAFGKEIEKSQDPTLEKAKVAVFEKHNVSCLAGVIKDRDNEYTKELIEKLGEDKYQQLTNSLDKYLVDGDRAGLREANTIIDRADRSVGGMNHNERFDRRDIFSNIELLSKALDARKNGDKLDIQIPGRDMENGTTVSRFQVFMLFSNLVLNSDIVYTVGKIAFESIRDNFISYYDEKNQKAADILNDILKEKNIEKEPTDPVTTNENKESAAEKPEDIQAAADAKEGQTEENEAEKSEPVSSEDKQSEDKPVEAGQVEAIAVKDEPSDADPVETRETEAVAAEDEQTNDDPVEADETESIDIEDVQTEEDPVETDESEPAAAEDKQTEEDLVEADESEPIDVKDDPSEDDHSVTDESEPLTIDDEQTEDVLVEGDENEPVAAEDEQTESDPVDNQQDESDVIEDEQSEDLVEADESEPIAVVDAQNEGEHVGVEQIVPAVVVLNQNNADPVADTDESKIEKARVIDGEWYEGKELTAEDIANLRDGAFAVIDNAEEKTGKELSDAAGWLQIARESGGKIDKADISRAHLASCEAYRKEGNTTNAFKEAIRVGSPVSYDKDSPRFQAIKEYASDCISKAKANEGGYSGTYLRAARVISLVPGLSNDFDRNVFDKAISEIKGNEDLFTAKDFELAAKWAEELGYSANDVEALQDIAGDKKFEDRPHDEVVIPAVQDRIEQSGDKKVNFGELYKEIKADVEAKLGYEYTERHFAEDVSVILDELNDRGEMNPALLERASEEFMDYEHIDVEIRDLVDESTDDVEKQEED